jgi:hypothetical protein
VRGATERQKRHSLFRQQHEQEVDMSATGVPSHNAGVASFASTQDLASALRRAEAAHGEHEKRTGQSDENWPAWYAEYIVAEQAGTDLPT